MKKIAFLSNINIDPLKNHFEKTDEYAVYSCGYNQWQPDLLNTSSELYKFSPDLVYIYINVEEFKQEIHTLFTAINVFCIKKPDIQFVISNFMYPPFSTSTYLNKEENDENEMNMQLKNFTSKRDNIIIFDFNRIIKLHGYKALFDEKYWYLGRIKFSNQGFKALSTELNCLMNCVQGRTKKVLILDLDNTLWGGIVGEVGWQNLLISTEGIGKIYADFQQNIRNLSKLGILLALCSKNEEEIAKEVFEKNKNMLLKLENFAVCYINWNNKVENIIRIASALNLNTNSMVFIDDNPVERELVRNEIKGIIVPEFPKDITQLNSWFINDVVYPYFGKRTLTNEDLNKTTQYQHNVERENIKHLLNYDDFIQQLQIKLSIKKDNKDTYQRVSQLSQKTNQFNLSVKRYTEAEIYQILEKNNSAVYTCEYSDKFGKEGIIGCAILKVEDQTATLDSFMLSCRVLGRKVEFQFLDFIKEELRKLNLKLIKANYTETLQNLMIKTFLLEYGFITKDDRMYNLKINGK